MPIRKDEKVLKLNGSDGCTTIKQYLIPLNVHLKVVKMVNFMLYILQQFFKSVLFFFDGSTY